MPFESFVSRASLEATGGRTGLTAVFVRCVLLARCSALNMLRGSNYNFTGSISPKNLTLGPVAS